MVCVACINNPYKNPGGKSSVETLVPRMQREVAKLQKLIRIPCRVKVLQLSFIDLVPIPDKAVHLDEGNPE